MQLKLWILWIVNKINALDARHVIEMTLFLLSDLTLILEIFSWEFDAGNDEFMQMRRLLRSVLVRFYSDVEMFLEVAGKKNYSTILFF